MKKDDSDISISDSRYLSVSKEGMTLDMTLVIIRTDTLCTDIFELVTGMPQLWCRVSGR